ACSLPFASLPGRYEMRSPDSGRRDPRWNALMCTKARSPPPLGMTKPKPFSSFHSVILPASLTAAPSGTNGKLLTGSLGRVPAYTQPLTTNGDGLESLAEAGDEWL